MPTHAEKRHLPYSTDQLYDLVADVPRYPEFLPWCVGARVTRRDGLTFFADLVVGFKLVREKFTSRVTLDPGKRVDVAYLDGPFRYLNNHWTFNALPGGGTEIGFLIDFEFRSKLLQTVMGTVFNEAVRRMVGAFEKRAHELYGDTLQGAPAPTVP